jgi:protein-tyrosine phosphatase
MGIALDESMVGTPTRAPYRLPPRRLRDLRHVLDSRLHPRRRRAAQTELQDTKPRSILFICHGNICRSPFAAALFARSAPPSISQSVRIASAGFIGPRRSPPPRALDAGAKYGVDISAHRSTLATRESLAAADLVVVMSEEQAKSIRVRLRDDSTRVLVLGDLDPHPIERRTILDPWGGTDAAFDASYDRIDRCVRELVRVLGTS